MTSAITVPKTRQLVFTAAGILLAIALSLLIGIGAGLMVLGLIGAALFAGLIVFGVSGLSEKLMTGLLAAVFAVSLIANIASSTFGLPIGYLFEVLMFGFLVGSLIHASKVFRGQTLFHLALAVFVVYLLLSILSSVLGRSQPLAALWQLQYNLKWPAMLLLGAFLTLEGAQRRVLDRVILLFWIPIALCVLAEVAAPTQFLNLLKGQPDFTVNPILGFGRRYRGPFIHSGYLALVAAGMAWLAAIRWAQERKPIWLLPLFANLCFLAASGQRQETMALFGAIGIAALLHYRRHWRLMLVFGVLMGALAVVLAMLVHTTLADKLLGEWGRGNALDQVSERYILSSVGTQIGNQWFPLGSGMGTYGGAGAQKFDQSLFLAFGFQKYWWFRQGYFLVDVYWPSVIAESGWFGFAALLTCFGLLALMLMKGTVRDGRIDVDVVAAFGLLAILLANSPTSAALTDPRSAFWFWLLIGAGLARVARRDATAQRASQQVARRKSAGVF